MSETITVDTTPDPSAAPVTPGEGGGERLFAGKYKSVEELEKGYIEAQKVISSRAAPAAATTTAPTTPDPAKPALTVPGTDNTAQGNGSLDWDALNAEYAENGKLSEKTYEGLASAGIPKREVDRYIAGRVTEVKAYDDAVYGAAGGQEQFSAVVEWAKTGLSEAEKTAFNAAVTSGNVESAKLAVSGLLVKYQGAVGKAPHLLNGKGGAAGLVPFKSQSEVTKAMRDPRYRSDPAYRKVVAERLDISTVF